MYRKKRYRFVVFLLIMVLTAMADQGVKAAMVALLTDSGPVALAPFFNLRLGYNTGVSFGMFADTFREAPGLLVAIKIGIVGLIALFALRSDLWLEVAGFALIAGGAAGNIIDRIRIGAVVDYVDLFYASWHWPTFNLADTWIFLGIALLIGGSLLTPKRRIVRP